MRVPINKEIDLETLAPRLKTVLGRDVALSARMPGQVDDNGHPLPGVLVLLDAATGEPLDLPAGAVSAIQNAVAAHVPPETPKSPVKALTEALGTASTIADLKAALVTYAGALVDREDKVKQRRQKGLG